MAVQPAQRPHAASLAMMTLERESAREERCEFRGTAGGVHRGVHPHLDRGHLAVVHASGGTGQAPTCCHMPLGSLASNLRRTKLLSLHPDQLLRVNRSLASCGCSHKARLGSPLLIGTHHSWATGLLNLYFCLLLTLIPENPNPGPGPDLHPDPSSISHRRWLPSVSTSPATYCHYSNRRWRPSSSTSILFATTAKSPARASGAGRLSHPPPALAWPPPRLPWPALAWPGLA